MNADKNPKSIRIYHTHTRSRSHNGINEELSNIFITFYAVKLLTLKLIYCSVHALQLLLLLLLLQFIRLVLLNIMSICARARVCLLILIYTFIFNVAKMKISYQWLVNTEWSWLWIDATIFGLFVLFHFIMLLIMLQLQLKWRSCLKNWHALDCDYDFCWKIIKNFVQWHITVHVITTTSLCNLFFSALSLPLFNF